MCLYLFDIYFLICILIDLRGFKGAKWKIPKWYLFCWPILANSEMAVYIALTVHSMTIKSDKCLSYLNCAIFVKCGNWALSNHCIMHLHYLIWSWNVCVPCLNNAVFCNHWQSWQICQLNFLFLCLAY